jgi:lysophospholipid acyltransferase (LPLAT)-like uncharacterized protein
MHLKQKIIGFSAFLVSRLLSLTLSVKVITHPSLHPKEQYIYCFWHGKQFMPVMRMRWLGNQKHVALVSASRDGEMLTTWLKAIGYRVIRGSSSRKAVSGLKNLLQYANQGYSLGIAADGPRGPIFQAKSGVVYLAAKTGVKIVPISTVYQSAIQLNAWDRYELPKPFSKTILYLGEPIMVPKEITENSVDIQKYTEKVMQALQMSEAKAAELLS